MLAMMAQDLPKSMVDRLDLYLYGAMACLVGGIVLLLVAAIVMKMKNRKKKKRSKV